MVPFDDIVWEQGQKASRHKSDLDFQETNYFRYASPISFALSPKSSQNDTKMIPKRMPHDLKVVG